MTIKLTKEEIEILQKSLKVAYFSKDLVNYKENERGIISELIPRFEDILRK